MNQIPVYKEEVKLGLAELIVSDNKITYASVAKQGELKEEKKTQLQTLPAIQSYSKAANYDQIDLFPIQDILVSCGWNDNEDIFLAEQIWAARNTPTDKPFNLNHSPREIIGHITDQFVLNAKGEVIADDTPVDELPDSFDILNNTVIYRFYNDAEYKKKIDKIIEEISTSDKWKVSMEALFTDYDYGVQDGDETIIIPRNSKTASLTKHLKAYKGSGVYQGKKLGRVLKNIVFCGKGLTDNPANPKSLITGTQPFTVKADKNNSTIFNLGYTNLNEGDIVMNENELKTKLAETEVAVANSKVEIEKLNTAVKEKGSKVSELEASLAKSNDNLTSVASKVAELEKNANDAKAALATKTVELTELTEKYTKAEAELAKINADKLKDSRISTMVEKLKMTKELASDLYTSLASLNDEQFASYVEKSEKSLVVVKTEPVAAETVVASGKVVEASAAAVIPDNSGKNVQAASKIKEYFKASKGVSKDKGDK